MAIFLCPEKHHLISITEILVSGPVTMPATGQPFSAGTLSGTCPVGKIRHQHPFHGSLGPASQSMCVRTTDDPPVGTRSTRAVAAPPVAPPSWSPCSFNPRPGLVWASADSLGFFFLPLGN